ncbi:MULTISPECIES: LysR family transcriptional regulator [unclassified Pseudomonas]|uniref:LysR family transcriptional regulator n=1 Tax=unclassified Pseudomonas TaxID=196821 RepID=UPI0035C05D50
MRFDLESLKVFIAVVEEGSLAKASLRQHLVASAVSKRMSDLESDVGTPLLYRHCRGVSATPAGEALYHHAKKLVEHLRTIAGELDEYSQGIRGHARIHVNLSAMVQYLPKDLESFLQSNGQIKIDLMEQTSDQVVRAVAIGSTDIGICSETIQIGELSSHRYKTDALVVIVPQQHELAHLSKVSFSETLEFDYIGLQPGSSIHKLCKEAADACGHEFKVRIQASSFEGVRNMVSAGLGIGVLPLASVEPYRSSSLLTTLELDEPWSVRHLQIIVRDLDSLPAPSRLLFEHLTAAATSDGAPSASAMA